jgi:hypothetical protein
MSSSFRALGARARQEALRTLLIASAASVGTGLLLTACSASSGSASPGSLAGPRAPAAHQAANGPAFGATGVQGTTSGARAALSAPLTNLTLSTQSIIYTASLSIRVKGSVPAAASQATADVTGVGGYVASEQEFIPEVKGDIPQVNLVLKIPVAQFGPIMQKLAQLGRQLSFSQQAQNVTQQVADVTSRVASAQAAITQLRALLSKAGSVTQLLSVQNEINNQESDLEALLAQQRALVHETSYGTVTVTFVGQHARIVKHHKKTSHGFAAGLRGGWHALGLVVGWVLTALGSALPFLIPVALIGGIALGGRRRLARRKSPPAPEPPAASAS